MLFGARIHNCISEKINDYIYQCIHGLVPCILSRNEESTGKKNPLDHILALDDVESTLYLLLIPEGEKEPHEWLSISIILPESRSVPKFIDRNLQLDKKEEKELYVQFRKSIQAIKELNLFLQCEKLQGSFQFKYETRAARISEPDSLQKNFPSVWVPRVHQKQTGKNIIFPLYRICIPVQQENHRPVCITLQYEKSALLRHLRS